MAQEVPEELWVGNIGQKILVMKDEKILMCRGTVTFHDLHKWWDLPGGRMHKGEGWKDALVRELREEFGVDFVIGKPLHVSVTYETPDGTPRYYVVFEGRLADPNAEFTVPEDEISEVKWVSEEEIGTITTWEDWRVFLKEYFETHAA